MHACVSVVAVPIVLNDVWKEVMKFRLLFCVYLNLFFGLKEPVAISDNKFPLECIFTSNLE
jgi:hypothetical protein